MPTNSSQEGNAAQEVLFCLDGTIQRKYGGGGCIRGKRSSAKQCCGYGDIAAFIMHIDSVNCVEHTFSNTFIRHWLVHIVDAVGLDSSYRYGG